MASKAAQKRLSKEYIAMQREPPPFIWAAPDEKNILNWSYLIRGPPDSPYAGGEYHGVLMFPPEYPFKPPGIKMYTPSGRFQTDRKICFSMSDFHPGSWNPAWSVATILTGLLSFMLSDEMTTGSLNSSDELKRSFAARSHTWNLTQARFREAFPEHATPEMRDVPNMGEKERGVSNTPTTKVPIPTAPLANSTPSSSSSSSPSTSSSPIHHPGKQPLSSTVSTSSQRPAIAPSASTSSASTSSGTPRQNDPNVRAAPNAGVGDNTNGRHGWRYFFYEKWRLCAVIALAVLVSKFSRA